MTKDEALKLALELEPFVHGLGKAILRELKEVLAQPDQERNFCQRCGRRLGIETDVHTCTPPAPKGLRKPPVRTFDDYGNKIK